MRVNQHGATFHLTEGGMPNNWLLTAIYGSAYGIAYNAAGSWHFTQAAKPGTTAPGQALVEVNRHYSVTRSALWLGTDYGPGRPLGQLPSSPFFVSWEPHPCGADVEPALREVVLRAVQQLCLDQEVLLPRPQWEAAYPDRHAYEEEAKRQLAESLALGRGQP